MVTLGYSRREMAKILKVNIQTLDVWKRQLMKNGVDGLLIGKGKGARPGARQLLSTAQLEEIAEIIKNHKPREYGFEDTRWQSPYVLDLIAKKYGINMQRSTVSNKLRRMGFRYNTSAKTWIYMPDAKPKKRYL